MQIGPCMEREAPHAPDADLRLRSRRHAAQLGRPENPARGQPRRLAVRLGWVSRDAGLRAGKPTRKGHSARWPRRWTNAGSGRSADRARRRRRWSSGASWCSRRPSRRQKPGRHLSRNRRRCWRLPAPLLTSPTVPCRGTCRRQPTMPRPTDAWRTKVSPSCPQSPALRLARRTGGGPHSRPRHESKTRAVGMKGMRRRYGAGALHRWPVAIASGDHRRERAGPHRRDITLGCGDPRLRRGGRGKFRG